MEGQATFNMLMTAVVSCSMPPTDWK